MVYVDTIQTLILLKRKGSSNLREITHLDLESRGLTDTDVSILLTCLPDLHAGRLRYINLSHNRKLKNRAIAMIFRGLLGLPVTSSSHSLNDGMIYKNEEAVIREELICKKNRRCRLEEIYLDNCGITCPPLRFNAANHENLISELGSMNFQTILKSLSMFSPFITSLSLSENPAFAQASGLWALMPVVKEMKQLSFFSFCRLKWADPSETNSTFNEALEKGLTVVLPHLPLLQSIDLRQNNLSKENIERILEILPSTFLIYMNLKSNPGYSEDKEEHTITILAENRSKFDSIIHTVLLESIFGEFQFKSDQGQEGVDRGQGRGLVNRYKKKNTQERLLPTAAISNSMDVINVDKEKQPTREDVKEDVTYLSTSSTSKCTSTSFIVANGDEFKYGKRESTTKYHDLKLKREVEKQEREGEEEQVFKFVPEDVLYYEIFSFIDSTSFSKSQLLAFYNSFMLHKLLQRHRKLNNMPEKAAATMTTLSNETAECKDAYPYPYEKQANFIFRSLEHELTKPQNETITSPRRKTEPASPRHCPPFIRRNTVSNIINRFEAAIATRGYFI